MCVLSMLYVWSWVKFVCWWIWMEVKWMYYVRYITCGMIYDHYVSIIIFIWAFFWECEWLRSFALRRILLCFHFINIPQCCVFSSSCVHTVSYNIAQQISWVFYSTGLLACLPWPGLSHLTRPDHITEKRAFILLLRKMFNTYLFKHANNISWMSYYLGCSGAVLCSVEFSQIHRSRLFIIFVVYNTQGFCSAKVEKREDKEVSLFILATCY